MRKVNYYLWLQQAIGPGAENSGLIFETFSSAEEIFRATDTERRISGVFTAEQIERMNTTDIEDSYKIMGECAAAGVDILTPLDDDYPKNLLNISDYPIVLYVKGSLDVLKRKIPIAIVGTRKPAPRSIASAQELSKALTKCGFVVISGGALGIDTAAHTGAISVGEETIAVLGCGHLFKYLKTNEPLRDVISTNGATISEYPPSTDSFKWNFPIRNRIISGMSVGTIVVEGKKKSGSLITAKHAMLQNRDVFALPSAELGATSDGCEELLKDGAIPVEMPMDVISEYLSIHAEKIKIDESIDLSMNLLSLGLSKNSFDNQVEKIVKQHEDLERERADRRKPKKRELTDSVSDEAKRVYAIFTRDPISMKEIADSVIMPASSLLGALTELELLGYIELLSNTKYSIK